jgi:hypothetical protein
MYGLLPNNKFLQVLSPDIPESAAPILEPNLLVALLMLGKEEII